MNDTALLRISGVFALLSAAAVVAAIVLGIAWGGGGPVAIDFGDPAVLASLQAGGAKTQLLEVLALAGPTLALGGGLGWRQLLARDGSYVSLGVLLWYLGMVFVIGQDAAELALVFNLPWIHQPGAESAAAVLAMGDMAGELIAVFTLLGDVVSFGGLLLVNVALLLRPGAWKLLGAAGALSGVLICGGLALPALAAARLPGFMLFMIWNVCMGVIMLRARPPAQA